MVRKLLSFWCFFAGLAIWVFILIDKHDFSFRIDVIILAMKILVTTFTSFVLMAIGVKLGWKNNFQGRNSDE